MLFFSFYLLKSHLSGKQYIYRFGNIMNMSFLAWMGLVGALLLLMALSSAYLRRLPITTSAIYLALGVLISPVAVNLIDINFVEWRVWFEHLTEIAVIVSLVYRRSETATAAQKSGVVGGLPARRARDARVYRGRGGVCSLHFRIRLGDGVSFGRDACADRPGAGKHGFR